MILVMTERFATTDARDHTAPASKVPDAAASPKGEAAALGVPSTRAEPASAAVSAALATQAVAGDRAALEQLLRLHARDVLSVCHHVAGVAEARDAAQETFENAVRELARFDPTRGSFRSWITTIARNVCRDRLRRRTLERGAFSPDGDDVAAAAEGHLPDPERLVIAKEGASTLSTALAGLPAPMREAIVMFHLGESSYEEIARVLDVPMGTVMTWLHRGRQRLRAAIEEP